MWTFCGIVASVMSYLVQHRPAFYYRYSYGATSTAMWCLPLLISPPRSSLVQ